MKKILVVFLTTRHINTWRNSGTATEIHHSNLSRNLSFFSLQLMPSDSELNFGHFGLLTMLSYCSCRPFWLSAFRPCRPLEHVSLVNMSDFCPSAFCPSGFFYVRFLSMSTFDQIPLVWVAAVDFIRPKITHRALTSRRYSSVKLSLTRRFDVSVFFQADSWETDQTVNPLFWCR